jgi:hypothetical protein
MPRAVATGERILRLTVLVLLSPRQQLRSLDMEWCSAGPVLCRAVPCYAVLAVD